ncbi:MAG: STAS domain-containing protein [Deltaproteobacteria bacterium]|nr:STAS domain-containing protein [Deltaproteobacteria bacterium]
MQHSNEIKLEKQGEVTIFDIQGDITSFSEPFLDEAYQKANDQDARKILLKIGQDAYINSGGIALLIQMMAQIKRNNQSVVIAGISEHFKKIFNMVGITKFAKIFDTVEAALEQLTAEPA